MSISFFENYRNMNLIDEIIDDPLFYRWVFEPDDHVNRVWSEFMREHPDAVDDLLALKQKLEQVHVVNRKLKAREKEQLARRILLQTIKKRSVKPKTGFRTFLQYAAIILLAFGVGGTVSYFIFHDSEMFIVPPEMQSLSQISVPTLILPQGESVALEAEESKIDYSKKGMITLNGSKVIATEPAEDENNINQVVIPYGSRSVIQLSDSTMVYLNAGSRLVYPSHFEGNRREVCLFGEAFFSVAKDKAHPFIVHTADLSVQVHGTKFNVCAYPDENIVQTVLTEGLVSLRPKNAGLFDEDIVLHPNQMASYSKESKAVRVQNVDVSYYTVWTQGVIKFSNQDLNRVLKRVERFYNISFSYSNPFDAETKISGKLNLKKEKEEVFEYISRVAQIEIEPINGNRYRIN